MIIYCDCENCEFNISGCCDGDLKGLISINSQKICESFELKETPEADNPDAERDVKDDLLECKGA